MDTQRKAGWPQGLVIIMVGILPMMAIVTLMPIVPALVKNFQHVPGIKTLAPLVLSAPGLCVALFSPFAGILCDRIGRRHLLLVFTALYGIGGVLPFFMTSFEALMGSRLLLGIGEAFILTLGNTLLGDYFEKEERAKWLTWQSLVGPVLGSMLIASSGSLSATQWNLPFLIYGVALLMAGFAFFAAYEPQRALAQPSGAALSSVAASLPFPTTLMSRIAVTTFVLSAVYFVYTLQFSLALDALGVEKGGDLGKYTSYASFGVPVGALLFRLIAGRSTVFQFTVVFMLLGLGMVGIGLSRDVHTTVALAWIQQLGSGMTIPVLINWSLRELPAQFRGRGMGWWASAFFLGQFVSPLFVGFVSSRAGGLLNTFVVAGALCICIAVGNALFGSRGAKAG
jgi:MFS family permease